ncbi:MAG: hypothetical protein ABWY63_09385 [Hyphomicrobiaceae bacterium]|jgi:hypothetical protein
MSKKFVTVALLCTVIAVVACRREERYYAPMKLGADAPVSEQASD